MAAKEYPVQALNVIGGGRVGQTLAHLWSQHGPWAVQDVLTTHTSSAQAAVAFIGAGRAVTDLAAMRAAPLWLLATPDAQLAQVAHDLAQQQRHAPPAMAFHCSGALASTALAPLASLGWQVASAHCILSFASPAVAVAQFAGTPCALEGDPALTDALQSAFETIGARCFTVASSDKLLYHGAAVFATNFIPVLQHVAEALWQASGVPPEVVTALRASLLRNAVANITALGPQAALTGPGARGDTTAIARQAQALQAWDPATGAAYAALSELALRMAGHSPPAPKVAPD
jgi:predicted short-subunit dehydrogenase-like oxidoreductase (DUF2520 family)